MCSNVCRTKKKLRAPETLHASGPQMHSPTCQWQMRRTERARQSTCPNQQCVLCSAPSQSVLALRSGQRIRQWWGGLCTSTSTLQGRFFGLKASWKVGGRDGASCSSHFLLHPPFQQDVSASPSSLGTKFGVVLPFSLAGSVRAKDTTFFLFLSFLLYQTTRPFPSQI